MSIVSGYNKYKRYILTNSGYKLVSQWTNANTVEMDDGSTLQSTITSLNSTLSSDLLKSKDVTVTVGSMAYDGYYIGDGDTGLSTSSKLVSVQVIGSSDNHAAFVGSYQQSVQKFRVNCVVPNITVYVRVWYI